MYIYTCLQDSDFFTWGHEVPVFAVNMAIPHATVPWASQLINDELKGVWDYIITAELVDIAHLKSLCVAVETRIAKDTNDVKAQNASQLISKLTNEGSSGINEEKKAASRDVVKEAGEEAKKAAKAKVAAFKAAIKEQTKCQVLKDEAVCHQYTEDVKTEMDKSISK